MDILYCSTVCSKVKLEQISQKIKYPMSSVTIQKFHRLILNGLTKNDVNVETISVPPTTSKFLNIESSDIEDTIKYNYIWTIEFPIIRHLCIFLETLCLIICWFGRCRNEHVIICDALNVSVSMGALFARFFGVKIIAILTDMPGLMINNSHGIIGRFIHSVNRLILSFFDGYIFLTEQMNAQINKKRKPYIIMEGLVDIDMKSMDRKVNKQYKNIIYAGGIHEKYGIKTLLEAFHNVKGDNLRLILYGRLRGNMMEDIDKYEAMDSRIHYLGVKSNKEIIKAELEASLLVNPRPTTDLFTMYSFPSKNMEYMVSGTPVLTTALAGMPREYFDKVFVCYDESVKGFTDAISRIMDMSEDDLNTFGNKGKQFVLKNKNNVIQAFRIIELSKKISVKK